MRILHTADLHIGKSVHDFSMLEDQRAILTQITEILRREKIDVMLLAGDIYDRTVPSAQAVTLLDEFLTKVSRMKIPVIAISGNHDSPERLEFLNGVLEKQGIFISGIYKDVLKKVTLEDSYGKVTFICLPYFRSGELGLKSSQEVAEKLLAKAEIDTTQRNVLLTHYFVTDHGRAPELSDSETALQVGGIDNVEAEVFEDYDYVALGHIHRPQQIGDRMMYYAGSPLKYSFSEANQEKSVNIITLKEKGDITVTKESLKPVHDMRKIRGTMEQILQAASGTRDMDYIQVSLTDEDELYNPMEMLRSVYPNVMELILTKNLVREDQQNEKRQADRSRTPMQMFEDFYREVRREEMDEARKDLILEIMKEAEEECR